MVDEVGAALEPDLFFPLAHGARCLALIGDQAQLDALYGDLGRTLKAQASGWDAWVLSGNAAVTGALRMKASRRIPVSNGGIDCRWLHYQVR